MGSSTKTKQVGSGYTKTGSEALTNLANFGKTGMTGSLSGMSDVSASGVNFDPNSYWRNFMGQAGDLQGLITSQTSDLQQGLTDTATRLAGQSAANAASNLSGLGSLYSGATLKAASEANANAFADVANQLGSQTLNLYGNLLGSSLSGTLAAQGQGLQAAQGNQSASLQAQIANNQNALSLASLYGNLYGTGVSGLASYGTPTYVQSKSGGLFGSGLKGALGGLVGGAGIANSLGLAGAAANPWLYGGAALGGASGLLG